MHSQPLTTHPQGAAAPSGINRDYIGNGLAPTSPLCFKHLQGPVFKKTANTSAAVVLVLILFEFSDFS